MTEPKTLFTMFKTQEHCYVYDTYSNEILRIHPDIWQEMGKAVEAASARSDSPQSPPPNIQTALADARRAGFLLPCRVSRMAFYRSDDTLRTRIENAIPQLTLEVTERCNLSCHYCVYSYDQHRRLTPATMSLTVAQKATDIFLAHSGLAQQPAVSFWGGEPLLEFRLICQIVEHINRAAPRRKITYSFTTNGTLITPESASFLSKHRFNLLVSLDGPQHIHDRHRRRKSGGATFRQVLAGLRHLRDADPAYYFNCVRFNCVLPTDTPLDDVRRFFAEHELLSGHHVTISAANPAGLPSSEQTTNFAGLADEHREQTCTLVAARPADSALRQTGGMSYVRALERIAFRPRKALGDVIHPNGCCVPLLRRMVVRPNGDVHMCEQPPYENAVGNVHTGVDFDAALTIVHEYTSRSLQECSRCWAMRLCTMCYKHMMRNRSWAPADRATQCEEYRNGIRRTLADYASICEQNPSAFDYLKDMVFVFPV